MGTLVYVVDRGADRVLMIHRNARADDDHLGKWNGLGGKVEPDEDVVSSARREVREEAGIEPTGLHLRGTMTWTGFGPRREDWLAFLFVCDAWTGTPLTENPEGTLEWIPVRRLLDTCSEDPGVREAAALPMWAGDRHFVPLVLDDDPRQFHGTMPYDMDTPLEWRFVRS